MASPRPLVVKHFCEASQGRVGVSLTRRRHAARRFKASELNFVADHHLAAVLDHPDFKSYVRVDVARAVHGQQGLFTVRGFAPGDVVTEIRGRLVSHSEGVAVERALEASQEDENEEGSQTTYCFFIATSEAGSHALIVDSNCEAYFINHSAENANVKPKASWIRGKLRVYFVALKAISHDEELLFDYADRRIAAIRSNPWLKY